MVWGYAYEKDTVALRSTKSLMQVYDLYTTDRFGQPDTSLESIELQKIDDDGGRVMTDVLAGDGSSTTRTCLAEFLAVILLRTPAMVARYGDLTRELLLQLVETSFTTDYDTFLRTIREKGHPGFFIPEDDYEAIKAVPQSDIEAWVDQRLARVGSPGGDPDLPHTDAIRDPTGRKKIMNELLAMNWVVKRTSERSFILGDSGADFDIGNIVAGLRVPLSPDAALYIQKTDGHPSQYISFATADPHEVSALNYESAARATRWLIGLREDVLMPYVKQVRGH